MKIILEGCEGVGKTTLAKQLVERYGLDYVHITNKDPNDYMFYKQTLRKEDVIYDRHFLGEMIYPKIYNRKGNLDARQFRKLLKFARKECVHILILTTDLDIVQKRVAERNKYKPDFILNSLSKIHKKFFDLGVHYGIYLVDTSKMPINYICSMIENEFGPWGDRL